MERVLVGMSGGVDSSVAAYLLKGEGYDVTGVCMLLWGGARQGSSCSTADSRAAQEAAQALGIDLLVVDWRAEFDAAVTSPYRADALQGITKNPCFSCNKAFKLSGLTALAMERGFAKVATGHYARVSPEGLLMRAADAAKDQSYVLASATRAELRKFLFPLGPLLKSDVRSLASRAGLPSASAEDSMGLCLDRKAVLEPVALTLVDLRGRVVGSSAEGSLLTVGQRRGIGLSGEAGRTYVLDLDTGAGIAYVGDEGSLLTEFQPVSSWQRLSSDAPTGFQSAAHGTLRLGRLTGEGIAWQGKERVVSPGQVIVAYRDEVVVGYGTAGRVSRGPAGDRPRCELSRPRP